MNDNPEALKSVAETIAEGLVDGFAAAGVKVDRFTLHVTADTWPALCEQLGRNPGSVAIDAGRAQFRMSPGPDRSTGEPPPAKPKRKKVEKVE